MYSEAAEEFFTNISEQLQDFTARLEERMRHRTFEVEVLYELTQHIDYTLDYDELFRLLLTHLHCAMPSDVMASLLTTDTQTYELIVRPMRPLADTMQEFIIERLLQTLTALGVTCAYDALRISCLEPYYAEMTTPPIAHLDSLFIFPLIVARRPVGLFLIGAEASAAYNEEHIRVVYRVANQVRDSIERLRELLEDEQQRLEQLVESIPDGVVLLNANRQIVLVNPSGRTYLNLLTDAQTGEPLMHLGGQAIERLLVPPAEPGNVYELVVNTPTRYIFEVAARAIAHGPETGGWVLILHNITEQRRIAERIQHMALYDPLTDLPNRMLFRDRLQVGIAHAMRTQSSIALLFLDLDRFKAINDSLGHAFGDRLLQTVAKRLLGCVRQSDTVARLGGDEFTVILSNLQSGQDTIVVVENILRKLAQPFQIDGHEVYTSASVGVAIYPTDTDNAENLIKHADAAMYCAKEKGRNTYAFYTTEMYKYAIDRLALENDLRRALEREELILHYQPQVDLHTGALLGLECLVRWQHPTMGLLYPAQFLWVAEDTGLMPLVSAMVFRMACIQHYVWKQSGIRGIRIAVNISPRHLVRTDIVREVAEVLEQTGVEPHYLELELTEDGIMRDAEAAAATLHKLKALGVRIAVDDFGTGYSSLSYLKRFPINTLKIDQSFVRDVPNDSDSRAIVRTIIAMAHNLKLDVIAEGVEHGDQASFLLDHGCTAAQGYLYSVALSASEIEVYLRKMITPPAI